MWSVPASANLGWISEGKQEHNTVPMLLESWLMESRAWERKKLNERPIYLRSVFFMLATLQSLLHLYYDYDKVLLPPTQSKTESTTEQPQKEEHPLARIKALLPNLAQDLGLRAAGVSILGPIIYALFIRRTAWSCSLWLAELLWDVPASQLSYIPPYHISLILRSLSSGVFLLALWEASNALFGAYVAQEPIKKGQPLTSEAKDPNGALLNGLKSKRGTLRVSRLTRPTYRWLIVSSLLHTGSSSTSASDFMYAAGPSSPT
jgi:nucleoporin NDC1